MIPFGAGKIAARRLGDLHRSLVRDAMSGAKGLRHAKRLCARFAFDAVKARAVKCGAGSLTLVAMSLAGCATTAVVMQPAAPTSEDDREALHAASTLLGGPLPAPHHEDPLRQAIEVGFEATKVELRAAPAIQSRATTARADGFQGRVRQIEFTFPGGCDLGCARAIKDELEPWLGAPTMVVEGHAEIWTFSFDTTTLTLEIYPRREDLTRIILECVPLAAAAAGRSRLLPPIGERAVAPSSPVCRALPAPRKKPRQMGSDDDSESAAAVIPRSR